MAYNPPELRDRPAPTEEMAEQFSVLLSAALLFVEICLHPVKD